MFKRRGILAVAILFMTGIISGIYFGGTPWITASNTSLIHAQIYFVDSEMMRLVSTDCYYNIDTPDAAAQLVIKELIAGRDENTKIRRVIPKIKNGLTVELRGQIAYVDISADTADSVQKSRLLENLFIYQIVNSLTSIDGIQNVRFTINGQIKKDLAGFIDMRETFIPDYYV